MWLEAVMNITDHICILISTAILLMLSPMNEGGWT